MNIAILIPELGGGGAERVAQILGNYYVEKGNKVYYFIADTNIKQDYPVKGEIIQTNIKSCMQGELSDAQRMMKLFCASLKMRKLKAQYKIDVAISFMEEFNYLNILSKGKERVIVRVCTILSEREELKGFLYKKKLVQFFYTKADKVIVMSQYALNDMHNHYGIPLRKLIKIPNPASDLGAYESENLWPFGMKAVICIGRLEPVKQHERTIRAFSYVVQREPDARLIILGKGSQLYYLKSICKSCKIEKHVDFIGFTNNISYYLEHARVFVIASKVEGFPNSMIEAMHHGVPVITTDSPGACGEIVGKPKEVVDNNTFTLCKYGILTPRMLDKRQKAGSKLSEQEIILGEAMLKVLTQDDIYEKYRKRSYRRADMFDINKVMKKWDSIMKGK